MSSSPSTPPPTVELPALDGAPAQRATAAEAIVLANALHAHARHADAERVYRAILRADPDHGDANCFLGMLLVLDGRVDEAMRHLQRAAEKHPQSDAYQLNLGLVHESLDRVPEAVACYRRAAQLRPAGDLHCELSHRLSQLGELDLAIEFAQESIRRLPAHLHSMPCNNLGIAQAMRGDLHEAVANLRKAVALDIENAMAHSNLLMTLNYLPDADPAEVFREHRKFGEKFESFVPRVYAAAMERAEGSAARRLRIGYVSPDFRQHAVASLFEPALTAHDAGAFEVFCYSNNAIGDAVTARMRAAVPHWRAIDALSDADAAKAIQSDGIDILVDLSGHTANNRLPLFMRKPAPIQATWIGYPATTGLSRMDYRITDAIRDPVGASEALNTETLVRLPETCTCYQPPEDSPPVAPPPSAAADSIMFGSFNNIPKMNAEVLALWARILERVPRSRLTLKYRGFHAPAMQAIVVDAFARLGIGRERLVFLGHDPYRVHLRFYDTIDVALDPFPYNGDLTTCDALWMGVPVVALAGKTHASRMSAGRLAALGLHELIAKDPQDYVDVAVRLAQDLPRRTRHRAEQRERMRASPLMDAPRFARNLEAAFTQMWNDHRRRQGGAAT
jgi:predicted O-linked N-acetylglucosamine transferase (SPINDLY family)